MESPAKKRRIDLAQSGEWMRPTSTPLHSRRNISKDFSPLSDIRMNISSSEDAAPEEFLTSHENSDTDIEDTQFNDYEEFLIKIKTIPKNNKAWKLYKPICHGTLYYQIATNPKCSSELAKWFVGYSKRQPSSQFFGLYRLFFDSAGYQQFDLEQHFSLIFDFKLLLDKLSDLQRTNELLTIEKCLFEDGSKAATILKYGIYNFLEKFTIQCYKEELMRETASFESFITLIMQLCKSADYVPLIYTAYMFVIKILTGICKIKNEEGGMVADQNLDKYLNILYVCFTSFEKVHHKKLLKLNIECMNELLIWIRYSAKIFVHHFDCLRIYKHFSLDALPKIRLAALECCRKIIEGEQSIPRLNDKYIAYINSFVWDRVYDIDKAVQLKAFEIVTTITTNFSTDLFKDKTIFLALCESIYNKDYRLAFYAGKCLVKILSLRNPLKEFLLWDICKVAHRIHPHLKFLLVEACIDHTDVLQHWALITRALLNSDKNMDLNEVLSELFLESVHITLNGRPTKMREFSKNDRAINQAQHQLIASEVYPALNSILTKYLKNDVIVQNIFKLLVKLSPDHLTEDHIEAANQLIQRFVLICSKQDNIETLNVFQDYLLYINQHLPLAADVSSHAIEDLKCHVIEEWEDSLNNQGLYISEKTKKVVCVFAKFDLNNRIEWSRLVAARTVIVSNDQVENIWTACHWSLIWRIRKLINDLPILGQQNKLDTVEMNKEINSIQGMLKQLFQDCYKLMSYEDPNVKQKAFERLCETMINVSAELQHANKRFDALKPTYRDEVIVRVPEIMKTVQFFAAPTEGNDEPFSNYIRYIFEMACGEILPIDSISIFLQYYDKYYSNYGKLIEAILIAIYKINQNLLAQLIVNTFSIMYENILQDGGVLDFRSFEAQDVYRLARRFSKNKSFMESAGKMLIFAVNYSVTTKRYDFLHFVRGFISNVELSNQLNDILKAIQLKVPESDKTQDAVVFFVKHIQQSMASIEMSRSIKSSKAALKDLTSKKIPKARIKEPKNKGKKRLTTIRSPNSTDTNDENENMSIHDTSSDDLSLNVLNEHDQEDQ